MAIYFKIIQLRQNLFLSKNSYYSIILNLRIITYFYQNSNIVFRFLGLLF